GETDAAPAAARAGIGQEGERPATSVGQLLDRIERRLGRIENVGDLERFLPAVAEEQKARGRPPSLDPFEQARRKDDLKRLVRPGLHARLDVACDVVEL